MADSKKKPTRAGGESVGRHRGASDGDRGAVVGGSVNNSEIVNIHNDRVDAAYKFSALFLQIEGRSNLSTTDKFDLKSELKIFEDEDKKGPEANEGFLAQHLRNIRRIAPDILDAVIAVIANPAVGFGTIAKKVAEKMKIEVK